MKFCENSVVHEICDLRGWGAEMSFEDARLDGGAGVAITENGGGGYKLYTVLSSYM